MDIPPVQLVRQTAPQPTVAHVADEVRKQWLSSKTARRIKPGMLWMWREEKLNLMFLVVRESSVGMTRMRFVENIMMTIARDYTLYGLTSLAIAPLGSRDEWVLLRPVVEYWLKMCPLPISVYGHE